MPTDTKEIEESDNFYLIRADVPGVEKKDIDVHMDNGVLSITGEKHEEKESGKGTKRHRTGCLECAERIIKRRGVGRHSSGWIVWSERDEILKFKICRSDHQ
jgi:hypothetical protein